MIKVYIEKKNAPNLPMSLVFWPNFRFEISPKRLFLREIMEQYRQPFFEIVLLPEEADFFAVPHEYFFVEDEAPAYLHDVFAKAEAAGKKVLLFDYTDYVDRMAKIPAHAILFRVSAYRHHRQSNEIVMPYFVEDIGLGYGIAPKGAGAGSIVGYCGQTQFGSRLKKWRAIIKRFIFSLILLLKMDKSTSMHARGIFWRAKVLRIIRRAGLQSDIIERPFYSLHSSVAVLDADKIRREYVENMRKCDIALCVRGDANASQRFYETLSSSRIPLFVDTDCVLPLEEIIDYDSVLIRVPANTLRHLPQRFQKWIDAHPPSLMKELGQRARRIFDDYLRIDRYFDVVFNPESSPYKKLLFTR